MQQLPKTHDLLPKLGQLVADSLGPFNRGGNDIARLSLATLALVQRQAVLHVSFPNPTNSPFEDMQTLAKKTGCIELLPDHALQVAGGRHQETHTLALGCW